MSNYFSFKRHFQRAIRQKGGWVNAHAHLDRAFTMDAAHLDIYQQCNLQQKWDVVDQVKRESTTQDYYRRICYAIEMMLEQGVTALTTFIDIDPICKDRAILGALKAREEYRHDIELRFANQTLKGVIDTEARHWFDIGAEMVDIIGGLPYRDELAYGKGRESLDILMETGKRTNKMLHIHVDQFNHTGEKETELLCDKTIEHGMQGRVVAVHGISIAAHDKAYREALYRKMRQAQMMIIACPTAWIDSPRKEELMPFHNALTPIDELIPAGITVALGTDNISDYMVPFCEGDMWKELTLLAAGCRFTDIEALVQIATDNGRKVMGLTPLEYAPSLENTELAMSIAI